MTDDTGDLLRQWRARIGKALLDDDVGFIRANIDVSSTRELLTIAQQALNRESMAVSRFLLEHSKLASVPEKRSQLLAGCCGKGALRSVRYLLSLGVPDLYNTLPLVKAAMSGRVEIVELLLEAGADPNQGIPGFPNALDVAVQDGFADIAMLLRVHGAQPGVCRPGPSIH